MKGDVQFVDVHFRYPTRPTVRILRHFSLKCLSKNTTALVGPSGSGKSTTVALLQRFYDPLRGQVLLDGHNIRVLNLRWLRSLMGLVQQEPVLFNLSIRENIAYEDNSRVVTQEEIEAAARMANIHDLIIALPQVCLLFRRTHSDIFEYTRDTVRYVAQREVNFPAAKSNAVSILTMVH